MFSCNSWQTDNHQGNYLPINGPIVDEVASSQSNCALIFVAEDAEEDSNMNSTDFEVVENIEECSNNAIPSFYEYIMAMTPLLMGLTAAGGFLFLITLMIYYRNLNKLVRRTPKDFLARTLLLCGIYQVSQIETKERPLNCKIASYQQLTSLMWQH